MKLLTILNTIMLLAILSLGYQVYEHPEKLLVKAVKSLLAVKE